MLDLLFSANFLSLFPYQGILILYKNSIELVQRKQGVYICCVPDPYLRKNLVSSISNLNSYLCYQTWVKLQRFLPDLARRVTRWWTTGRLSVTSSHKYNSVRACKIISRSSGNQHPDSEWWGRVQGFKVKLIFDQLNVFMWMQVTTTSLLWPGFLQPSA